jgi:polar amino acid transport system permease protein
VGPGPASVSPDPLVPGQGRGPKLFAPLQVEGAKSVLVATVSTVVVIGVIVLVVVRSPNWPLFKAQFFNGAEFAKSFPDVVRAFARNIKAFLIAEPLILALALLLAVMRALPGAVFFPIRLIATLYVDIIRGIPTILLIYLLGFGIPALDLPGVPNSGYFWGVVALILSYSAYVAEVFRAGIESVHPSQTAAARSLGLGRGQTLRYVVVPQASRRVVPPLMNDFIALQKDTALISIVTGIPEAFLMSQIYQQGDFNFTPILGAAICFLVLTIPMTRLADWLIARQRTRRQAGASL